mgnify:CR=1 FL=1
MINQPPKQDVQIILFLCAWFVALGLANRSSKMERDQTTKQTIRKNQRDCFE